MSAHALRRDEAPAVESSIAPAAAPPDAAPFAVPVEPSARVTPERGRRWAAYVAPTLAAFACAAVAYLVYRLTANLDLPAVLATALTTSWWTIGASLALS